MKRTRWFAFVISFLILFSAMQVLAETNVSIAAESIRVGINEQIVVPLKISNNIGMCGATLTVSYDKGLKLKEINRGDALASMTLTKPGDLMANPFNLIFDGVEEDNTNGVFLYLHFDAVTREGVYGISVSYEDGDIVDGDLQPLSVTTIGGNITVEASYSEEEEPDDELDDENSPKISVETVVASAGGSVDVSVYVENNPGICGATLKISYHNGLKLTNITKGDSFNNLVMTKPGSLLDNPINIIFDGIEEEKANGMFFVLTFQAPQEDGEYRVSITYEAGDIVDGDLNPVDIMLENGGVLVGAKELTVTINGKLIEVPPVSDVEGDVFLVFYNKKENIVALEKYNLATTSTITSTNAWAEKVRIFCWTKDMKPLCKISNISI